MTTQEWAEARAREASESCDHVALGTLAACVPCQTAALIEAEARGHCCNIEYHGNAPPTVCPCRAEGERAGREKVAELVSECLAAIRALKGKP